MKLHNLKIGLTFITKSIDGIANANFATTLENIAANAQISNPQVTIGSSTVTVDGVDNSTTDRNNLISVQNVINSFSNYNALQISITPSFFAQLKNLIMILQKVLMKILLDWT